MSRKIFLILFITLLFLNFSESMAQMQTIQLDKLYMHFDNGRELPAEEAFIVHIPIKPNTALVKMQISNKAFDRSVLYENQWIRKNGENMQTAIVPNYLFLRAGSNYNFRFLYYDRISDSERTQIFEMLVTTAQTYIQTQIRESGNRYSFENSPSQVYKGLNTVLTEGMKNYEIRPGTSDPQFSGIIENMLRTMVRYRIPEDADSRLPLNDLLLQVENEISMFVNSYEFVIEDLLIIMNYPTEKKESALAIKFGYGGIYNSGSFSDLSYYSAPYAGISLPLGNRVFAGNFWGNTSLSAGVFLTKFEENNLRTVSGPLIDLPIYTSLNYRVFRFIQLQAGATLMEVKNHVTENKSLKVRPFVGLSIEFNVCLGGNR